MPTKGNNAIIYLNKLRGVASLVNYEEFMTSSWNNFFFDLSFNFAKYSLRNIVCVFIISKIFQYNYSPV